jgi:hypothetical protein
MQSWRFHQLPILKFASLDRTLKEENKALAESFHMEMQNYRRMSQQHEELQWRLKQSSEVISRLSTSCAGILLQPENSILQIFINVFFCSQATRQ